MCGIAGIIHRNGRADVGREMTSMLYALRHRGPDSSGFALYGDAGDAQHYALRFKLAEGAELKDNFSIRDELLKRQSEVDKRMEKLQARVSDRVQPTEYARCYKFSYDGDVRELSNRLEDVEGVEILSIGHALELVKDLGSADQVAERYGLEEYQGTHAIGHTRMATESDVDIRSAHPYWAYPFSDVSVVHNGQLTNYWGQRRRLERGGHRFMSNCDSEIIAVYIADRMYRGQSLEEAMHDSVHVFDGVFSYLIATADQLGMAKDTMAAKPMVIYEGEDVTALASEEIAIRSIFPQEIETYDPYEGVVKVWAIH